MKKVSLLLFALLITGVSRGQLTGIKTIKTSGGDYSTFTQAITALNTSGVGAGGVTFNVDPGFVSVENCPVITATGTLANSVVFQKSGTGANPIIKPTGTAAGTADAGIAIKGGDYFTFDGIDVVINTGSYVEYGYYIFNFNGINGSQHITIKNCAITLNRNNANSKGIYQWTAITVTSVNGANSYNTFDNIVVQNSAGGIYLKGFNAYPDLSCIVKNSTAGAGTSNDLTANGISISASSGVKVFNNEVRNITGNSAVNGLYFEFIKGTTNAVYNNKVHDLNSTSASYSAVVYGIQIKGLSGMSCMVYNNMVYNLFHETIAQLGSQVIQGMSFSGSATGNFYFNSVRIETDDMTASTCFSNAGTINFQNNILSNFSPSDPSATASKYCISSTGTISVADYNDYYIVPGLNNFIGLFGSSYTALADWQAGTSLDSHSVSADPMFVSPNDLHIQPMAFSKVRNAGLTVPPITDDIDGNIRSNPPTIGASEAAPFTAPIPTVSEWVLILLGLALLGIGTTYILKKG
ncbi:MAG: hypothetical protein NT040_01925 [Bacteroidetes bacterium]|nr:hypothetical protein [Bacteroidota bacterium]